ncbi:MAG TPA: hypothetical protein VMJ35_03400 [Dongiaceae bacterium]|nr:hypothetical protein [Dongiaceae bacterium]
MNKALVVGSDGLSSALEGKGESEQGPELAWVAGRAAGAVETGGGGEEGRQEIETIAEEESGPRGPDKGKLDEEQGDNDDSGNEEEARKPARRKQEDLTLNN